MITTDIVKKAIREILKEHRVVFAELTSNDYTGGQYWAPLYNGQEPSEELIDRIAVRAATHGAMKPCHLAGYTTRAVCGQHHLPAMPIAGGDWACSATGDKLGPRPKPERKPHTCYGVTHEFVDDEDDHRELIMRCGERFGFIPAASREEQKKEIDCPGCNAEYAKHYNDEVSNG